jgi:hypothetical protein
LKIMFSMEGRRRMLKTMFSMEGRGRMLKTTYVQYGGKRETMWKTGREGLYSTTALGRGPLPTDS